MSLELIIGILEKMDGNYCRRDGDTYISSGNMDLLQELIKDQEKMSNMLITPYLINEVSNTVYELHYYEFELEIMDIQKSFFVEFSQGNTLPEELINNIRPKGVVAKGDKEFYLNALQDYLFKMRNMKFEYDKENDKSLKESRLYFQIF